MKKNISINISGIIFYIEEDGYEALRCYLDSIAQYFSTFESSKEIVDDIENRIAEIFASKRNSAKQMITAEDVQAVIRTMGNVKDFQEAGEEQKEYKEEKNQQGQSSEKRTRLFRDEKRKFLGGVCAGIGHYCNIDPLWPRLVTILFTLLWGAGVVIYLVLWLLLPSSPDLSEITTRKVFRNPDGKIIGGVAGGLAAYLGINTVLMRLIFVLSIFLGGAGVVIYILGWIFLPEAKTITDKMNMKGQPLTLNNIESSIKNVMHESDKKEESALASIVLFPFRLLAAVLNGLVKILGPLFRILFEVIRVFTGFVISVVGLALIIATLAAVCILLGLFSPLFFSHIGFEIMNFPIQPLASMVGGWTVFFAALASFIPALLIFLLGISILTKRLIFSALVGWVLAGLLIISIISLAIFIPRIVLNFKETGDYVIEKTFDIGKKTTTFKINEIGWDDYNALKISFSGYDGKKIKLTQRFEARGSTRKEAIENAKTVTYTLLQKDSLLILDSNITFPKEAGFNAQELHLDFQLPYHVKFRLPKEMQRFIQNSWDGMSEHASDIFEMTRFGLTCVTCERMKVRSTSDSIMTDFDEIELQGAFNVKIVQGNTYSISAKGNIRDYYTISKEGETLNISSLQAAKKNNTNVAELVITMPLLDNMKVHGAGFLNISGFDLEDLDWEVSGLVDATFTGHVKSMKLQCEGASNVKLKGKGEQLDATVVGASRLNAYEYQVELVELEVHGASSAEVFASKELKFEKDIVCSVNYKGSPSVTK